MLLDWAKCVPSVVRSLSVVLRTLHRRASNVNKDATPGDPLGLKEALMLPSSAAPEVVDLRQVRTHPRLSERRELSLSGGLDFLGSQRAMLSPVLHTAPPSRPSTSILPI